MTTAIHTNADGTVLSVNGMDFDSMCNMMAWNLSKAKNPVAAMRKILFFGDSIPTEDEWTLSHRERMPEDWPYAQQFLVNKAKIRKFIESRYLTLADFHKVLTSELAFHEALNINHFVFVMPPERR